MKRRLIAVPLLLALTISCTPAPEQSAVVADTTTTQQVVSASPTPTKKLTMPPITPRPLPQPPSVFAPQGKPPALDGILSPGEWEGAALETFSNGSELLLMHSDGYLYLGIRADTPEMIAGNIFIVQANEIKILHASAALGTARYKKGAVSWQQTQEFVWRCRQTSDSQAAQAERQAFLEEEGWLAANARMGLPNELEFQIEMTGEILRLAINYLTASNPNVKIPWPGDLNDDCIAPTPGGPPEQMHFSPEQWGTISTSPSQT